MVRYGFPFGPIQIPKPPIQTARWILSWGEKHRFGTPSLVDFVQPKTRTFPGFPSVFLWKPTKNKDTNQKQGLSWVFLGLSSENDAAGGLCKRGLFTFGEPSPHSSDSTEIRDQEPVWGSLGWFKGKPRGLMCSARSTCVCWFCQGNLLCLGHLKPRGNTKRVLW